MVKIQIDKLYSRTEVIPKLLSPFIENGKRVACSQGKGIFEGGKIIAAHDKRYSDDPREWLFKTHTNNIWAKYHELWLPESGTKSLILTKVYLTLSLGKESGLRDLICLHCDPNENSNDYFVICQHNPHLHIKAADAPLHRSHFPLSITEEKILNSLESITNSFEKAIKILNYEVLKNYS